MANVEFDRLTWEREGADWPHREASRFVNAAGLRWHVQEFGARGDETAAVPSPPYAPQGASRSGAADASERPIALLLHGTGASTHSWAGLAPLLAENFRVIAMDLPGHAFTDTPAPQGLSLPGMARSLSQLLAALGVTSPQVSMAIGHSAGAAIAVRMALDGQIAPKCIVSLNGALLPLSGLAGQLFLPTAKLLAATTWAPKLFSRRAADPKVLQRLLDGTGSTVDAPGAEIYGRLVRSPAHVAGALGMMANWDLRPIERELPRLQTPLHLIIGEQDRTIPPAQARRVQLRLPSATIVSLPGLGHLAHEEQPARVVDVVMRASEVSPVHRAVPSLQIDH